MCKTYRECKANAPRKEGSLSCRKKGAELKAHVPDIFFNYTTAAVMVVRNIRYG